MACPDMGEIAQVRSLESDSATVEHLKHCKSCWLDWQIVHGTRYALDPPGEVPQYLNARVMAEITRRSRQLEKKAAWWELSISGVLVAVATFAYLVLWPGGPVGPSMVPSLVCAIIGGVSATLFFRKQDESRLAPQQ